MGVLDVEAKTFQILALALTSGYSGVLTAILSEECATRDIFCADWLELRRLSAADTVQCWAVHCSPTCRSGRCLAFEATRPSSLDVDRFRVEWYNMSAGRGSGSNYRLQPTSFRTDTKAAMAPRYQAFVTASCQQYALLLASVHVAATLR